MGKGLKQAWENPGQFGKSLIDWDDLSHGCANEAIGELLPGILGGIATGASGTAASRGLKRHRDRRQTRKRRPTSQPSDTPHREGGPNRLARKRHSTPPA